MVQSKFRQNPSIAYNHYRFLTGTFPKISVNWSNGEEDNRTPLQACVLMKKEGEKEWLAIETAELLILNGAKIDGSSSNSQSVLDAALLGGAEPDMMQYLMTRIS